MQFFNFPILAPPIEILFKQPPPVGIGPLPPFIVPPCLAKQSPPEESADKVTQSIIEDFKFHIKELTSKISMMAAQMQQAAQSSAEAAAAAASLSSYPSTNTRERRRFR